MTTRAGKRVLWIGLPGVAVLYAVGITIGATRDGWVGSRSASWWRGLVMVVPLTIFITLGGAMGLRFDRDDEAPAD